MSECKLNHSREDVKAKYESQLPYLPEEVKPLFSRFFEGEQGQERLNEVFHLLKKFDLASSEEKAERISRLYLILQ